jgi:hypothetical protein
MTHRVRNEKARCEVIIVISFEQEVKAYLDQNDIGYNDGSSSYKHVDFTILLNGASPFYLEVKEKRQKYNLANWPHFTLEERLFIVDDLTVRKCLANASSVRMFL